MRRSLGIITILILALTVGIVWAAFSATVTQPVTVTTPFTVSVASSASGVTCTGSTTITCTGISLAIGGTETLTATIVYGSQPSVVFTSTSTSPSIATIAPASGTVTSPTTTQQFTVTGVSAGSTSVSLSFQ